MDPRWNPLKIRKTAKANEWLHTIGILVNGFTFLMLGFPKIILQILKKIKQIIL